MSNVKSIGWLEWAGTDVLRSPISGAREPPISLAKEREMWVVDDLSSIRRNKKNKPLGI